jgi:hypothetical protein
MPPKRVEKPCAVFEIRYNRETFEDFRAVGVELSKYAKKWVVQLEKGSGGYEHWQGRMSLIKKKRKTELISHLNQDGFICPNFLAETVSKEHQRAAFYCMKEDTRIDGPWTNVDYEKANVYIPRQFRGLTLYPWQQAVIDSGKVFCDRTVDCIIDLGGCNGKSTVARICMLKHNGIKLPCHNDGIKLIQATCNMLMKRELRNPSHIFVDMPRAMGKEKLLGLYTAIEEIKGGYVYDERNHYTEWWYDSPRVWVFTNQVPDFKLLSADRWKLWAIKDGELVPYYDFGCDKLNTPSIEND